MDEINYRTISNTIWNVADLLRGSWKSYEYQDVVLPLTVLKRLDVALEPTKQKTLERFNELDGKVTDFRILRRVTGYDFYNISPFTFKKLLDDPAHVARNLRKYIDGYSDNVKEIFAKFDFEKQLERLEGSNILYLILKEFDKIDLHPDSVPNHVIGLAFEDLIRRFAEQSNETAGEHYTPRDVVRLMTALLFSKDDKELSTPGRIVLLYDPACGTGGMLTVGKEYIKSHFNKDSKHIELFGQELNSVTYAICKADMLLKGDNPDHIKGGDKEHDKASTLSNDQHHDKRFDYIISNPPYGVEWKKDEVAVRQENERGMAGRFGAGLPRISDGQLLFLQHVISKFKPVGEGGSEAAVIFNGSPLFTGDAGGGESEIRRWILENDYLDAIIALPEELFFNTGIGTYIWLLSNRKEAKKKGKVLLVDARSTHSQLRKSFGAKRHEISEKNAKDIIDLYNERKENEYSKVFLTTEFAYREIVIQRPLRLRFEITPEKKELLYGSLLLDRDSEESVLDAKVQEKELAGSVLGASGKKMRKQAETGKLIADGLRKTIDELIGKVWLSRAKFIEDLESASKKNVGGAPGSKMLKTIISIIGERDENAEICFDKDGKPESDKELKDFERVPWARDVYDYFDHEVRPYIPDAWVDESVRDTKDGQVGIVGYEIPFTRYFYKYTPPRPLKEIDTEIQALEREIQTVLGGLDS